jgi:hypothetical protein
MFSDERNGLGKQVLNIAICECQGNQYDASNYFELISNYELIINVFKEFDEK